MTVVMGDPKDFKSPPPGPGPNPSPNGSSPDWVLIGLAVLGLAVLILGFIFVLRSFVSDRIFVRSVSETDAVSHTRL